MSKGWLPPVNYRMLQVFVLFWCGLAAASGQASANLPFLAIATSTGGDAAVAYRRLAVLQRGINISGWLGGTDDLSAEHIAQQTTDADLRFLHDAGMQYVRLPIDPVQITEGGFDSDASKAALARIDHVIDQILAAHLAVQITVFPKDDFKQRLTNEDGARAFTDLWRFLAIHFAHRDPEHVFYDLINEPEVRDPAQWDTLQNRVVQTIREVDQQHTLIACGSFYSGPDELLKAVPVRDTNTVYTFHWYEPFPFTHQGATWGSPDWVSFHNIPYPATPDNLRAQIAALPEGDARRTLQGYALGHWNEAGIRSRLALVRQWADDHGVPLICNEFGAYRDTAPVPSRLRYLHDVRTDLEGLHIGWAMWDYSGGFGLVTHTVQGGAPQPDAGALQALGLQVNPR